MVLAHIAQHPFQQTTGGGKQRLWRPAQARAEGGEHLIAGAGVIVAVDHPLRAQRNARLSQTLRKSGQAIARGRQTRLAA